MEKRYGVMTDGEMRLGEYRCRVEHQDGVKGANESGVGKHALNASNSSMGSMFENMSSSSVRQSAYCFSWYCSTAQLYAVIDESASLSASLNIPPSTDSASDLASSNPCFSFSRMTSSLRGSLPPPSTYSFTAMLCSTLGSA